jgi:hypothetical protein
MISHILYTISQKYQDSVIGQTPQLFRQSMGSDEFNTLVADLASVGRQVMGEANGPMVMKAENLLTHALIESSAHRITVAPWRMPSHEAIQVLLDNPCLMEIPYFEGSSLVFLAVTKNVLAHVSASPELFYPIHYTNLQVLLNGFDSVAHLSQHNLLAANGLPPESLELLGTAIDETVQLLQNNNYAQEARIGQSQFDAINNGMQAYYLADGADIIPDE